VWSFSVLGDVTLIGKTAAFPVTAHCFAVGKCLAKIMSRIERGMVPGNLK